ncbi:MAG: hypothetical protein J6Q41_04235, partial [Firmicutes bacterium]|nr:hypothetical protein [Bacillota bacterium]
MKMKKLIALVLAVVMVIGMTACTSSNNADGNSGSGEKPVIKISYPVLVAVPTEEGTVKVEEA